MEVLRSKVEPKMPPEQLQQLVALARRDPRILHQIGASPAMIVAELENAEKRAALADVTGQPCVWPR